MQDTMNCYAYSSPGNCPFANAWDCSKGATTGAGDVMKRAEEHARKHRRNHRKI